MRRKNEKLILGMMLVTASLSFSNDRDRGKDSPNFEELKLRAEISYEQKEKNDFKKPVRVIVKYKDKNIFMKKY